MKWLDFFGSLKKWEALMKIDRTVADDTIDDRNGWRRVNKL